MNKLKELISLEQRTKYFIWALLILSVASVGVFALLINNKTADLVRNDQKSLTVDPFVSVEIEGKSAMVWDVVKGEPLFEKNPDISLPLASLTKVMTALTASKFLNESDQITIDSLFLRPDGDSGLTTGDTWTQKDLLDYTLVTSSNDGAYALASVAEAANTVRNGYQETSFENNFIQQMNEEAKVIGLDNSRFWNAHGLDRNVDRGGAYGSARDMAKLFEYILKNNPDLLEATRYKNISLNSTEHSYNAPNTNQSVDKIPGIIASKTGYTDLAGGNLVIAFDAGLGRPIIISVLGSTQEGRFSDALKLVTAAMQKIQNY